MPEQNENKEEKKEKLNTNKWNASRFLSCTVNDRDFFVVRSLQWKYNHQQKKKQKEKRFSQSITYNRIQFTICKSRLAIVNNFAIGTSFRNLYSICQKQNIHINRLVRIWAHTHTHTRMIWNCTETLCIFFFSSSR